MASTTDPPRLTLGTAAPWVRRNVGPIAWAVLEALSERAVFDGTSTVSYRSVRDVAGDLHLANDTVARALRRLGDLGYLHHEAERSTTGRFGAGRYVLTLPPDVFESDPHTDRPTQPDPRPARPRRTTQHEQLALLAEPDDPPAR